MGLYKEAQHELVRIASAQSRIYNDAADVGVLIESKKDPLYLKIKSIFKENADFYLGGIKVKRSVNDYGVMKAVNVKFALPWEVSKPDHCMCSAWDISFIEDKARKKMFFTFDVGHVEKKESDIFGD